MTDNLINNGSAISFEIECNRRFHRLFKMSTNSSQDPLTQLYIVTGCLSTVILCVISVIVYLSIQTKRLKMDVEQLKRQPSLAEYLKPDIQPSEELAKRGFAMFNGDLNQSS